MMSSPELIESFLTHSHLASLDEYRALAPNDKSTLLRAWDNWRWKRGVKKH